MATSKIDICNSALVKLGVSKIQSFSETSKAAVLCNQQYDKNRKKLLRMHLWNFALKNQSLSLLVDKPIFGDYGNAFQLPSDCIRPVTTHVGDDFIEEGGKLLLNSETCILKYIFDVTDVSEFDTCFEEALAFLIASDLAYPLKQSTSLSDSMYNKMTMELRDARTYDGQTGRMRRLQEDVWINSRASGVDDL